MKSRRVRWARHVGGMGEMRNAQKTLIAKLEGNCPLGTTTSRWDDNIKIE
jgi:hypothetical protein